MDNRADASQPQEASLSLLILIGLVLLLAVLAASGVAGLSRRPGAAASRPSSSLLPMLGAALSLLALLDGQSSALPVPVGFAGGGGIQIDQLSALFLLLGFTAAGFTETAVQLAARDRGWLRLGLSGAVLTMLSGDTFLLALGGILFMAALARGAGGLGTGRSVLFAGAALLGAAALLLGVATPSGVPLADAGFARLRGVVGQPAPVGSVLLPLLGIAASVPLLGIWPCRNWHRRMQALAPAWAPGLASLLGVFLLLRLLLDLPGAEAPAFPGAVLVVIGVAGALDAAIGAVRDGRLRMSVGRLASVPTALMTAAIGFCLLARADDLPILAGSALDALLLLLPMQVLGGTGALALARAMEAEAGAGALERLGGLAQSMPRASLLAGAYAALLGFLLPGGVFAGLWLLFQDALAMGRLGGWLAILMPLAVLAMLLAAALSVAGWLRLASVAVLGRPRTPRGAAALDIPPVLVRAACAVLSLPLLVGLLPGAWLRLLAPLRLALAPDAAGAGLSVFRLAAPGGGAGLSPLPLLVSALLLVWLLRRAGRFLVQRPVRYAPSWEGGAPAPPPWLPFGDLATQVAAATLPLALRAALGGDAWPVRDGGMASWSRREAWRCLVWSRRASAELSRVLGRRGGVLALALLAVVLAWSARHPPS